MGFFAKPLAAALAALLLSGCAAPDVGRRVVMGVEVVEHLDDGSSGGGFFGTTDESVAEHPVANAVRLRDLFGKR